MRPATVLVVAGSDSGAGAGIQADIKSVAAMGAYATTAITALTAQNTLGVRAIFPVPPAFVRQQMDAVLDDIGADAVKLGMLGTAAIVATVADALAARDPAIPLVLDPVLLSTSGAPLLDGEGQAELVRRLLPRATLLTPNLPEAAALLGRPVTDPADAALALRALGPGAVLLKGGHADGPALEDVLADASGIARFPAIRIDTRHTHGTGCTLASAIAAGLAQRRPLRDAVARAQAYVHEAIRTAPGLGAGHGPLNHAALPG